MLARSNLTKAIARFLIALFAVSCVARAHPWHGPTHKRQSSISNRAVNPAGVYNLDKDRVADRVTLESNGFEKTIDIRFGNSRNQHLRFSTGSNEDGRLVAGDIDRDGDVDLVWLGAAEPNRAVVLLNQGEGDFAESSDNAPYASELNDLFNLGDPTDKRLVKHSRKSSTLTSSTCSDIAPGLTADLRVPAVKSDSVNGAQPMGCGLAFLTNDPERGPPSILS